MKNYLTLSINTNQNNQIQVLKIIFDKKIIFGKNPQRMITSSLEKDVEKLSIAGMGSKWCNH